MADPKIMEKGRELARLIAESREYLLYIEMRSRLEKDKEGVALLGEFRQKQIALEFAESMGGDAEAARQELHNTYEGMHEHPLLGAYLDAEARLSRMILDVQGCVQELLELGMLPGSAAGMN